MSDTLRIKTNHIPRNIIESYELSYDERLEFDYLNWEAIDLGEDSASFFRYKGILYDLSEFSADWGITKGSGLPESLCHWSGYISDSFFSGIVVRYSSDMESVVVGTFFV